MNYKAGHQQFAIFELGKTHFKGEMDANEPSVPNEDNQLAFVFASKQKQEGAAYYTALRYLREATNVDTLNVIPMGEFDMGKDEWGVQFTSAYNPSRSAVIVKDNQVWGIVGEFKPEVKKAFKLPDNTAGFEIHLDIATTDKPAYQPLSKFPSVTQDISLKVAEGVAYKDVAEVVNNELQKQSSTLTIRTEPVTIYQANDDKRFKTITFRVRVTSQEQTLKDSDVTKILDQVAAAAKSSVDAERI